MKHVLTAIFLLALVVLAGCQSNGKPAAVSPAEIAAWDGILQHSVAVVRASVAVQPAGPKRDKVLATIDQVQNWESLGAAVSEAVAAGFVVPTTQPSK